MSQQDIKTFGRRNTLIQSIELPKQVDIPLRSPLRSPLRLIRLGARAYLGTVALALVGIAVFRFGLNQMHYDPIGLTGSDRAEFISSGMRTCEDKQFGAAANQKFTHESLSRYCNCYMSYLADHVSAAEIKPVSPLNRDEIIKTMRPKTDAATHKCAADLANELKK
jgi:hypothetical protein